MFGHQDDYHDNQQHDDAVIPEATTDAAFAADMTHDNGAPAHDQSAEDHVNPALPNDTTMFTPQTDGPADAGTDEHNDPAPSFDTSSTDTSSDVSNQPTAINDDRSAPVGADSGLLDIKTQALQQLSPLVDHLDQSPEEKFRTTMMMIQASDDQSLVKTAYEAAQAISDPKTKAQALLDIVNEINYFTHQDKSEA